MNEAMGLATMNPMVGTTYKPFSAIMMVDNYNHDKDINDGWSTYRVARTLDKDSQYIEVDDNGKLTNRDTWDTLYRPKDSLENMILFSIIIRQVKFEILYNVAANTIEGLNS